MTIVGEAFIEITPVDAGFERDLVAQASAAAKKATAELDGIAVDPDDAPLQRLPRTTAEVADRMTRELADVPVDVNTAGLVTEVQAAARTAATRASGELDDLPTSVDVGELASDVGAAAKRAATEAAQALDDVPVRADAAGFVADVGQAAEAAGKRARTELGAVPVMADASTLDASVVAAARAAAKKAASEMADIPGGVDAAEFQRRMTEAANAAATKAAARLANIPADVDVSAMEREVAQAAARAAAQLDGIDVEVDASRVVPEVDRAMAGAERRVDQAGKRMAADTKGAMDGVAGTVAKGFALIGGSQLIFGGVQAARDARTEIRQTEAVIRSTGGAAGVTAEHIKRLTGGIEDLTAVNDVQVRAGANLLLTFTAVRNEVGAGLDIFDRAVGTMTDMAATMDGDVKGSAIQLGKALQDPIAGVSALAEVGVNFTATQKEQIRLFVEGGDKAKAQALILDELAIEFGGVAAATVDDLDRMAVKWDDFKVRVGTAVLGAVGFVSDLPPAVTGAAAALGGLSAGAVVVSKVADAVENLGEKLGNTTIAGRGLTGVLSAGARAGLVVGVVGGLAQGYDALADAIFRLQKGPPPDLNKLSNQLVRFGDDGKVAGELASEFGDDLDGLAEKIRAINSGDRGTVRVGLVSGGDDAEDAKRDIDALDVSLTQLVESGNKAAAANILGRLADTSGVGVDELRKPLDGYAAALTKADTQQRLAEQSGKDLGASATDTAGDLEEQTTAAEDLAVALDTFKSALDEALGVQIDSERSALNYVDTMQALRDSVAEGGKSLDLNTEAGRRNREAILSVIEGARDHVAAMADEGASADDLNATWQTHRGELGQVLSQLGLNKAETQRYKDLMDKVPRSVFTKFDADTKAAEDKLAAFRRQIDSAATLFRFNFGPFAGREQGGAVVPGGTYLVGERQAETARFGSRSYTVGADGPQVIHVHEHGWVYPTAPPSAGGGMRDVPRAAAGALVRASADGTLMHVGEGGQDEAIVPLPPGLIEALQQLASGKPAAAGGPLVGQLVVQGAADPYATGLETVRQLRAEAQRETGGGVFG